MDKATGEREIAMSELNYFSALCFFWAAVGIVSRIFIISLGKRWTHWELEKAYAKEKPNWIYGIALFSVMLVVFTWYQVMALDIAYSWIIAVLVTLTLIKVSFLLFQYDEFRRFVSTIFNDNQKLLRLNLTVFIFSAGFIVMGLYLY